MYTQRTKGLPAPSSQLLAPSSQLPAPSSQFPAPGSQLPAPSSRCTRRHFYSDYGRLAALTLAAQVSISAAMRETSLTFVLQLDVQTINMICLSSFVAFVAATCLFCVLKRRDVIMVNVEAEAKLDDDKEDSDKDEEEPCAATTTSTVTTTSTGTTTPTTTSTTARRRATPVTTLVELETCAKNHPDKVIFGANGTSQYVTCSLCCCHALYKDESDLMEEMKKIKRKPRKKPRKIKRKPRKKPRGRIGEASHPGPKSVTDRSKQSKAQINADLAAAKAKAEELLADIAREVEAEPTQGCTSKATAPAPLPKSRPKPKTTSTTSSDLPPKVRLVSPSRSSKKRSSIDIVRGRGAAASSGPPTKTEMKMERENQPIKVKKVKVIRLKNDEEREESGSSSVSSSFVYSSKGQGLRGEEEERGYAGYAKGDDIDAARRFYRGFSLSGPGDVVQHCLQYHRYFEVRESYFICRLCNKMATEAHLNSPKHLYRFEYSHLFGFEYCRDEGKPPPREPETRAYQRSMEKSSRAIKTDDRDRALQTLKECQCLSRRLAEDEFLKEFPEGIRPTLGCRQHPFVLRQFVSFAGFPDDPTFDDVVGIVADIEQDGGVSVIALGKAKGCYLKQAEPRSLEPIKKEQLEALWLADKMLKDDMETFFDKETLMDRLEIQARTTLSFLV